jgi:hypothetical protein
MAHITVVSREIDDCDMKTVLKQAEMISPVWLAGKHNVDVALANDIRPD